MNTAKSSLKIHLHQLIEGVTDSSILKAVETILSKSYSKTQNDWADDLPEEVIRKLEKSFEQSKAGQVISHEQVIENLNKRYPGLQLR